MYKIDGFEKPFIMWEKNAVYTVKFLIIGHDTIAKSTEMLYNKHVCWLNQRILKPKGVPI